VVGDYVALTKPRVMSLLLLTTAATMVVADRGFPEPGLFVAVLCGGALAAGGAAAINHALDRDLDAAMGRTRGRPVTSGRVSAVHALAFGALLGAASLALLWSAANPLAALLAQAGLVVYVLVYTMWLKRTTPQNIVIGGAAGAFPPLVAWAAVTGDLSLTAIALFAIVFYWTPPHFWALAILIKGDYARAGVPMLPVVAGERETARQILAYSVILAVVSLVPALTMSVSALYPLVAVALGAVLVAGAVRLLTVPAECMRDQARSLYKFSLLYLALLFCALAVAAAG
jgi:protoheme IX farnesyltransferase